LTKSRTTFSNQKGPRLWAGEAGGGVCLLNHLLKSFETKSGGRFTNGEEKIKSEGLKKKGYPIADAGLKKKRA